MSNTLDDLKRSWLATKAAHDAMYERLRTKVLEEFPYKVGDFVEVNDKKCRVHNIEVLVDVPENSDTPNLRIKPYVRELHKKKVSVLWPEDRVVLLERAA